MSAKFDLSPFHSCKGVTHCWSGGDCLLVSSGFAFAGDSVGTLWKCAKRQSVSSADGPTAFEVVDSVVPINFFVMMVGDLRLRWSSKTLLSKFTSSTSCSFRPIPGGLGLWTDQKPNERVNWMTREFRFSNDSHGLAVLSLTEVSFETTN